MCKVIQMIGVISRLYLKRTERYTEASFYFIIWISLIPRIKITNNQHLVIARKEIIFVHYSPVII